MALQKKNVLQTLQKGDDFEPGCGQVIVKYLKGVGNNLHEVEQYDGSSFLVTMPKKFRNVVYLAKGNCIVIDPIEEGNKVKGEIVCILEPASVTRLIQGKLWPVVKSDAELSSSRDQISAFFLKDVEPKGGRDVSDMYPSSSEDEDEESDDEDEDETQYDR